MARPSSSGAAPGAPRSASSRPRSGSALSGAVDLLSASPWWVKAGAAAVGLTASAVLTLKAKRRLTRKAKWNLKGKVVVILGGSRGVAKGMAVTLGKAGATVYIVSRNVETNLDTMVGTQVKGTALPGTANDTALLVNAAGGVAHAVRCDIQKDDEVKALFERVEREQGRLDAVVCAASITRTDLKQTPPFWTQQAEVWDSYHRVGVRSSYVAATHAVPLLHRTSAVTGSKTGLVVTVGSSVAAHRSLNLAHSSCEAMKTSLTQRMAAEFKAHQVDVAAVGLCPSLVRTERMTAHREAFRAKTGLDLTEIGESPEMAGRALCALLADPSRGVHSGKTLSTSDLALYYNFRDTDGTLPRASDELTANYLIDAVWAQDSYREGQHVEEVPMALPVNVEGIRAEGAARQRRAEGRREGEREEGRIYQEEGEAGEEDEDEDEDVEEDVEEEAASVGGDMGAEGKTDKVEPRGVEVEAKATARAGPEGLPAVEAGSPEAPRVAQLIAL